MFQVLFTHCFSTQNGPEFRSEINGQNKASGVRFREVAIQYLLTRVILVVPTGFNRPVLSRILTDTSL